MEHDNLDNSSRHLQIYKYRSIADIGRAHLDFDVKCLLFGEAPAMVAAMMMSTNVVKIGCRVLATLVGFSDISCLLITNTRRNMMQIR
jgi:hypothetical protein